MFSIQQLFSKGDRFQELLEAAAQECHDLNFQCLRSGGDGAIEEVHLAGDALTEDRPRSEEEHSR